MKPKTLLLALLAFVLLTASECEKEDLTLPSETQQGKNTIGCLIDGKVFVTGSSHQFGIPGVLAHYTKYNNMLEINANLRPEGMIKMQIFNPKVNTPMPITLCYYFDFTVTTNCTSFGGREIGEIVLTKFDTIPITIGSHIVSGLFKFDGQCSDSDIQPIGDLLKHFTEGRFDITLAISE